MSRLTCGSGAREESRCVEVTLTVVHVNSATCTHDELLVARTLLTSVGKLEKFVGLPEHSAFRSQADPGNIVCVPARQETTRVVHSHQLPNPLKGSSQHPIL